MLGETLILEAMRGDLRGDTRLAVVEEARQSSGALMFQWHPFDPVACRLTDEGEITGKVAIEAVGELLHIAIVLEPVEALESKQEFVDALEAVGRVMAGPSAKFFGRDGRL